MIRRVVLAILLAGGSGCSTHPKGKSSGLTVAERQLQKAAHEVFSIDFEAPSRESDPEGNLRARLSPTYDEDLAIISGTVRLFAKKGIPATISKNGSYIMCTLTAEEDPYRYHLTLFWGYRDSKLTGFVWSIFTEFIDEAKHATFSKPGPH